MDDKTIDYLERLIAGVRKQAKKEYGEFEGEPTIPARCCFTVRRCRGRNFK